MAKYHSLAGLAVCTFSAFIAFGQPAQALTMQECSAKYKAAQTAGTLSGMKWNDFRSKECGTGASAAPMAAPANTRAAMRDADEPAAPTRAMPRNMAFPKTISTKYNAESPGKGRMHTCLDSYNDAKSRNALNGMKWIEKGGGYYSFCNASLKGAN